MQRLNNAIDTSGDTHFLGWDVGGWNCDKNGKSRDAIVILNQNLEIVGKPWRGNLRVTRLQPVNNIGKSDSNPYLYRHTEHHLFRHGLRPRSAIKDMIGSQATKGMHTVAKFAPRLLSRGVWTDGIGLTAIEGYPSACKKSETIMALWSRFRPLSHEDLDDALTCAFLAYLFATDREQLDNPDESWIWVPKDVIG